MTSSTYLMSFFVVIVIVYLIIFLQLSKTTFKDVKRTDDFYPAVIRLSDEDVSNILQMHKIVPRDTVMWPNKDSNKLPLPTSLANLSLNETWMLADSLISRRELFPDNDTVIRLIMNALEKAKILKMTWLDKEGYEQGTANKWLLELEGGQKAMMKFVW